MTATEKRKMKAVMDFYLSGIAQEIEAQFGAFATAEEIHEAVMEAQENFVQKRLTES